MILVGIGANLSGPAGTPLSTCSAAISLVVTCGITIVRQSRWVESAPVPPSAQPWFINGVALIDTVLGPKALLALFHQVETIFGRVRSIPNASRVLDLDLLAYHGLINNVAPILPHPRLHERAFVVLPLAELVPNWYHPLRQQTSLQMAAALPPDQQLRWI